MTLYSQTTRAVRWSVIDTLARQGLQFVITIVLARILTPEDFGMIAVLAIFIGLASIFIDGGFSAALIQRQHTTKGEESTVFFFNLLMAGGISLILVGGAPIIAKFFGHSDLRDITYAMAAYVFLNSFASIHIALLTRELDLKKIALINSLSVFVAGTTAIYLALHGLGVWSLVVQMILVSAISVVLLWILHPWRPTPVFEASSLRSLFRFGGYEMAANLTDVFSTNLNLALIGKLYSVGDVGFYDRANKTQQIPINVMMSISNRVVFSTFSRVASDKERLKRGMRKAQPMAMLMNVPVMLGICILAGPLIESLFGKQWIQSIPILQVLAFAGLFWPLHLLNLNVLKAQGHADLFFWITIIKKTIAIVLTIISSFYGVVAIAWAQVASSIIGYFINAHYSRKLLQYGAGEQLRDLVHVFLSSLPMVAVTWMVSFSLHTSAWPKLVIAGFSGFIVYALTCLLFCREELGELLALMRGNSIKRA